MNSLRTFIAVLVAFALASPVAAAQRAYGHQALNQFRLQLGAQTPNGESVYWDDKKIDFSGDPDDFEDVAFAVDYRRFISPLVAIQVSLEGWEGGSDQAYIDFVDEFGNPIIHTTDIEQTTFGLGAVVFPAGRSHALIPYFGAGAEIVSWKLTEVGDFIDFGLDEPEVFNDFFIDENDVFGYYLQAGLEFAIGDGWALFVEGRWDRVEDELQGDFIGLGDLDLSSKRISAGVAWAF